MPQSLYQKQVIRHKNPCRVSRKNQMLLPKDLHGPFHRGLVTLFPLRQHPEGRQPAPRGIIPPQDVKFDFPCYENKTRSQELNLDNKCFQQSWKHHDKAVIKMAAVSEILVLQKIRLALPHGSHASLIHVCIGKAVFVRSFYVWLQNRIHRKECLALAWCK